MPVLTILPGVTNILNYFILLMQESKLSPKTKVAYTKKADSFKQELTRQLNLEGVCG